MKRITETCTWRRNDEYKVVRLLLLLMMMMKMKMKMRMKMRTLSADSSSVHDTRPPSHSHIPHLPPPRRYRRSPLLTLRTPAKRQLINIRQPVCTIFF